MTIFKYYVLAVIQLVLIGLVHAQDRSGFISIDCGLSNFQSYQDKQTGITYFADTNFTDTGVNRDISPSNKQRTDDIQLTNVRSFPEGKRNCYTLKPSHGKNIKYLIRARFMHGNYDGEDRYKVNFDLFIGADKWDTVVVDSPSSAINMEIIHLLRSDHLHVCLVNTGSGTPFISALEVRTINNDTYVSAHGSLQLIERTDYGTESDTIERYENDKIDRLWSPPNPTESSWPVLIASSNDFITQNIYGPPSDIMSTAVKSSSGYLEISRKVGNNNRTSEYYFYLFFAELKKLEASERREFVISLNNMPWLTNPFSPRYLASNTIFGSSKGFEPSNNDGMVRILINKTTESTLPPILNAMEIYTVKDLSGHQTIETEVEAIMNIKSVYGVKKNWQGDPCLPKDYLWNSLDCSFDAAQNLSTIISLNLSSTGLSGDISLDFAHLPMLRYLDLSNNSLSGNVPRSLAELHFLTALNLKGNNLTGPLPDELVKRTKNGLSLRADPNLFPCSHGSCSKQKHYVGPLIASLGGALFVLVAFLCLTVWKQYNATKDELFSKSQKITYSKVKRITKNFERLLGEGGFGKVYHGNLEGKEVAVKMLSTTSPHGKQQFQAELKLLLTVHHKNLTSLVGYCYEKTKIGLIYEYMASGNLQTHLSGNNHAVILSWVQRLRVAIDVAQGLEYLHVCCKPPIVHRDVKCTNILLNEKLEAKLADFGLSKIFPSESHTHILASVAGTHGYLDPEYFSTNLLNEKSDVYSFGVVLLEIITGRPAQNLTVKNYNLIKWVHSMVKKKDIKNIADPRMQECFYISTVEKTISIALDCASPTSNGRPTMSWVVVELKKCLEKEETS